MNQGFANVAGIAIVALIIGVVAGYVVASKSSVQTETKDTSALEEEEMLQGDHTSAEWKIENAMSAAPEDISKDATVLDWPGVDGTLPELRMGTNGWTCVPDYPASPGNDPICGDAMTMQWFQAYLGQKPPKLAQAGIGYMLQGGSDPSNTDPFATEPAAAEDWISAPPHIMIFPATPPDPKVYGTDPDSGGPWIMWANTPYAHLMVPVE